MLEERRVLDGEPYTATWAETPLEGEAQVTIIQELGLGGIVQDLAPLTSDEGDFYWHFDEQRS